MFNLYQVFVCYVHLIIFTWNLSDINVNYYEINYYNIDNYNLLLLIAHFFSLLFWWQEFLTSQCTTTESMLCMCCLLYFQSSRTHRYVQKVQLYDCMNWCHYKSAAPGARYLACITDNLNHWYTRDSVTCLAAPKATKYSNRSKFTEPIPSEMWKIFFKNFISNFVVIQKNL